MEGRRTMLDQRVVNSKRCTVVGNLVGVLQTRKVNLMVVGVRV